MRKDLSLTTVSYLDANTTTNAECFWDPCYFALWCDFYAKFSWWKRVRLTQEIFWWIRILVTTTKFHRGTCNQLMFTEASDHLKAWNMAITTTNFHAFSATSLWNEAGMTNRPQNYKELVLSNRRVFRSSLLNDISYPFEPQDNSSCILDGISLAYTCHGWQ